MDTDFARAQAPRALLSSFRAIFGELVLCHTFNDGSHHKEDYPMPSSRRGGAGVMDRCVGYLHGLSRSVTIQRSGGKGALVPYAETVCCQFSPGLSLVCPKTWTDSSLIQAQRAKES